jgi:hypothetical protein
MTAKQVEAAAIKLPKRDRARLVERLRETLQTKHEREIIDAWVVEAERRDRELDEGIEVALPYEEVTAKLRTSLRRR